MTKTGFESLPRRIFLDTNILQYLQDFGEFIFDHYQEDEEYLISSSGKKISTGSTLYKEIEALRFLLLGIDRTNIEFAISENTFEEVKKKQDANYKQWFFDMWDYWQDILQEYNSKIPSVSARIKLEVFNSDYSILGRLSNADIEIIKDAIFFDCNAILTTDKFRALNDEMLNRYKITILGPTDLYELLKPWQALWY